MALLQIDVAPEWVDYNGHMNDAEYHLYPRNPFVLPT